MTYIPDPKERELSREEFELFLENLRLQEVIGIHNVEFKNLSDKQILLVLDVMFGNAKKKGVTPMKDHEMMETLKLLADCLKNGLNIIDARMCLFEAENVPLITLAEAPESPVDPPKKELPKRLTPLSNDHMLSCGRAKCRKDPTPAEIAEMVAEGRELDESGHCWIRINEVYLTVRERCNDRNLNLPSDKGVRYSLHIHGLPIQNRSFRGYQAKYVDIGNLLF